MPPAAWPPADTPAGDAGGPAALDGDAGAPAGAPPEPSAKQLADDALFFLRMLEPFTRWQPPADTLAAHGRRLVLAVGDASGQGVARRSTDALAERLGAPTTTFPGDHGGFMGDPVAFAQALRGVLPGGA